MRKYLPVNVANYIDKMMRMEIDILKSLRKLLRTANEQLHSWTQGQASAVSSQIWINNKRKKATIIVLFYPTIL